MLFKYQGIPFILISKYRQALQIRLGNSRQIVFAPLSHFEYRDGSYRQIKDLRWWFNTRDVKHKIELYRKEERDDTTR